MERTIDIEGAGGRLARLVRHATVSDCDTSRVDWAAFAAFRADLAVLYPEVHRHLGLELVAGHSLLFHWKGRRPDGPVVLMSHYDVVPAPAEGWSHPPFGGGRDQGKVWGRGTLDTKGTLVSILEAVEILVKEGFVPSRDVWLAFGHDEEVAGSGAPTIAQLLSDRGLVPSLVVDEGGAVVEGVFPGVKGPIAVVGVAEKGIVDVELSVSGAGGHASTPPRDGPVERLARALLRIQKSPYPATLPRPTVQMLETLGRTMPRGLRLVFTHLWLFRPLVLWLFSRSGGEMGAMVRTTVAVTRLEGSKGMNVLPARALAHLNVRVQVGETAASMLVRLRQVIDDPKVEVTVVQAGDPSRVSDSSGPAWKLVESTINRVYPGALVVPYVMLAASDSRHWGPYTPFVYRFSPFPLSKAERESIHAVDEALPLESLGKGIAFYRSLLEGLA